MEEVSQKGHFTIYTLDGNVKSLCSISDLQTLKDFVWKQVVYVHIKEISNIQAVNRYITLGCAEMTETFGMAGRGDLHSKFWPLEYTLCEFKSTTFECTCETIEYTLGQS